MQNETIDKLKNAGYITVTDDSQGIADKVGVPEAFPYEFIKLPDITYILEEQTSSNTKVKVGSFNIEEHDYIGAGLSTINGNKVISNHSFSGRNTKDLLAFNISNGTLEALYCFQTIGEYTAGDIYIATTIFGNPTPPGTYKVENVISFY